MGARMVHAPNSEAPASGEDVRASAAPDDTESSSASSAQLLPTEVFVRRYSAETRPWIGFHCDRARCTVNVALADDADHCGGRLVAIVDGMACEIHRGHGEATVHSSRLCHAVTRMRAGTRYSLIAFFS